MKARTQRTKPLSVKENFEQLDPTSLGLKQLKDGKCVI